MAKKGSDRLPSAGLGMRDDLPTSCLPGLLVTSGTALGTVSVNVQDDGR